MTEEEQAKARENRAAFPATAAIVDEWRRAGVKVIVLWAEENGQTIGERPDQSRAVVPFVDVLKG